jgi:hypothetical protein
VVALGVAFVIGFLLDSFANFRALPFGRGVLLAGVSSTTGASDTFRVNGGLYPTVIAAFESPSDGKISGLHGGRKWRELACCKDLLIFFVPLVRTGENFGQHND